MENYEEKLREIINSKYYHSEDKAVFAKYFPELKENEDERMSKEIIKFLRLPHRQFVGKRDHEKWIGWLEKQKDYIKLPNSAYTSNKDVIEFADKYSHDVWEKLMDNFKKIENYSIGCNDVSDIVLNAIINTYNWLEKQSKKKSADEVMKIRRKAYSDGYMHGQDNIAISLGKESVEALEHFVRSIGESGYASPYDNRTKLVYRLLEQLKQIVK